MEKVIFRDLGRMEYKQAWDYQEQLLQQNLSAKIEARRLAERAEALAGAGVAEGGEPAGRLGRDEAERQDADPAGRLGTHPTERQDADQTWRLGTDPAGHLTTDQKVSGPAATRHYFLFVEHPPVYTLGKSGHMENILIGEEQLLERGIQFFKTNRGGDITYHGPGQIVGYPILDLERMYTDIGRYLRNLEEVIIRVMEEYGIRGERSAGETGVWIEPGVRGRERKICAIGVRCSRWVTMHGFAFNVSTDLDYFNNIIPCGIQDKQVTSLERELDRPLDIKEVKERVKAQFENVFGVTLAYE